MTDSATFDHKPSTHATSLYWLLVIWYVTFQLISDVTASKIISIGPAVVSVTVLYFPLTYIIGDILTEVYGFRLARRAVWIVALSSIAAGLLYQVVIWLPAGPGFTENLAYTTVLGAVPRVLIAGWIAVWAGSIVNDIVMSILKRLTSGRYLWVRTISSTVFGEGVNTAIFYAGALYGILPDNVLVQAILWGWIIKVGVEVVFTPVTYAVVAAVKRRDRRDTYDRGVTYNPFRF